MTADINKYQSSKIYKIINSENDEIYIGSTTIELDKRFIKHKNFVKTKPEASKIHMFMNKTGIEHFDIELVENFPCNCKEELLKRENEIIKEIGTLNERVAKRTEEEQKEYDKLWKQNNKDRVNERRRERRKENPEKTKADAQKYSKAHRERHKEELKAKASVKHDCPCGGKFTEGHRHEHMNSKRHLKYLGTFNEEDYKNSKRCEQLKQRYEKAKPNIDEAKMKEYKKKWYEKKKNEQSLTEDN